MESGELKKIKRNVLKHEKYGRGEKMEREEGHSINPLHEGGRGYGVSDDTREDGTAALGLAGDYFFPDF